MDAASPELAELIALRRPTTIYHLALLGAHEAPALALGRSFTSMLGVLEAGRVAGVRKVVVALPATAIYGHPSRSRPAGQGGPAGGAGRAGRRRHGHRRPAHRLPRGLRRRVHGAGGGVGLRAAAAPRRRRRRGRRRRRRRRVAVHGRAATGARPATSSTSTTSSTPWPGPASGGAGWWSTSAPGRRRPSATCGPSWRPRRDRRRRRRAGPTSCCRFAVSPVRARIHLGWSPWTPLSEGLAALRP